MVEAAEIPVVHKTSKHKTAGNSTYTSNAEAVDAGPDQQSHKSFICVQANETPTAGQSFVTAVKREDNGVAQSSSSLTTAPSSRENCSAIPLFQRAVKSFLAVRYRSM